MPFNKLKTSTIKKYMSNSIFVFIVTLIGLTSCDNEDQLIERLAIGNVVECEHVGFGGGHSEVYETFEKLKSKASKEKMMSLLSHDSMSVVVYAAYALIDNDQVPPDSLLQVFIDHDEYVEYFCGCLLTSSSLSSLIYHRYWNNKSVHFDDNGEIMIIDSPNLLKMDSVILFSSNPDWLILSRALENRIYPERLNKRIKEIAFVKGNIQALEYVFRTLRSSNENDLIKSLEKYIADDEAYYAYRELAGNMLGHLKSGE